MNSALIDRAHAWLAADPDETTRAELAQLLRVDNIQELELRFTDILRFGTAGLRAIVGTGRTRMNQLNVEIAMSATCEWLLENVFNSAKLGICLGYDGRRDSAQFAKAASTVALAHGFHVYQFSHAAPTPLIAFSHAFLKTSAAVVITASHNPVEYNGFKVFGPDGPSISTPTDSQIEEKMQKTMASLAIKRNPARDTARVTNIDHLEQEYVNAMQSLATSKIERRAGISIAYSPLHGVGGDLFLKTLFKAGFSQIAVVKEQFAPDPNFSTLKNPNPEDSSTLESLRETARNLNCDLAFATDPDADRVALLVKHAGALHLLSGNDVGCLLAQELLSRSSDPSSAYVLSSAVSSELLGNIAASFNAGWETTPTGHKWLQRRAIELEAEGKNVLFSYEEALGYSVTPLVRDKDGISAALLIADMAAHYAERGKTLVDALHALWEKYGAYFYTQLALSIPAEEQKRVLARLQSSADKVHEQSGILEFRPAKNCRILVRASGTESKLKIYIDVCVQEKAASNKDIEKLAQQYLSRYADEFVTLHQLNSTKNA